MTINVSLKFESYIAHPFWSAQKQLIDIQKRSGMNMARGEAKRKAALAAELEKRGLSEKDYERLIEASAIPFHKLKTGEIYIPARNFESFISHVAQMCPRAMRAVPSQNAHSATRAVPPGLVTDRKEPDGEFTRFVKLDKSNERSLQTNPYIEDFTAKGQLRLSDSIRREDLLRMIEWGAREVGMGAARSQGYGRFTVTQFDAA